MVVALSIMTTALFLFFDSELITYQRNKNEYLAKNAAESGLESGYRWLKNQVDNPVSNTFTFNGTVNGQSPNTPCLTQLTTPPNYFYTAVIQNLSTEFSSSQYENYGFDYYVIAQGTTTQNSPNLTIYETKFKIIFMWKCKYWNQRCTSYEYTCNTRIRCLNYRTSCTNTS